MCGILGSVPAVDEAKFSRALAMLAHRGPDGEGIWKDADSKVMLGHRRLAIIDTSNAAAQPFHYQHLVLTFNGAIYNYLELKKELEQKGHQFSTTSDTEVLAVAYAEWGTQCLDKLNGMWAFAVWDKNDNSLFLSRDRFGEKPLFYTKLDDKTLCFSSEMKALAPVMSSFEPVDDFAWFVKHHMDYEATERCLIKGIKRLRPGYAAIYKDGKFKQWQYWNTLAHIKETPKKYEDQVAQFRELLDDSIKLRLRADVPIGCSLSGGLDSSAVTALADNNYQTGLDNYRPEAFTATFGNSIVDELPFAKTVAKERGLQHHLINVDASESLGSLFDDIYYLEDVYRNPPSPMMRLYEGYRKQGTYVSLEGHGPDELFSGYGNFVMIAMLDAGWNMRQIDDITEVYKGMIPNDNGIVKSKLGGLFGRWRTKLWYAGQVQPVEYDQYINKYGIYNIELYKLFHQKSFPTLMRNYDRFAMRSGVEVRMPYTDHRLVSFCFGLPWQSKIGGGFSKRILRDATRDVLPAEIVNRKSKIGFQTPTSEWMKGAWKSYLDEIVYSSDFKQCGLVQHADSVIGRYHSFQNNSNANIEAADELWLQIVPYLWQQHFLNRINTTAKI